MSSIFTKSTGEQAEFKTVYKAPDPEKKVWIPDNTKIKAQIVSAVWKDVTQFNTKPQPVIEYMIIEKGEFEGRLIKQSIHLGAVLSNGEPNEKKRDKAIDFFASLLAISGKGLIQKFEKAGKPVEMHNELLGKELLGLKLIINTRLMNELMFDYKTGEPMMDAQTGKQRIRYTQYVDGCAALPKAKVAEPEPDIDEDEEGYDNTDDEPEEDLFDDGIPF